MGEELEGYVGEEQEEEVPFDINTVTFRDKTLSDWEDMLTVRMPKMPATSNELSSVLATCNDKFQIAYNCYNDLIVSTKGVEITYNKALDAAVGAVIANLKAEGVNRMPSLETLQKAALSNNEELLDLKDRLEIYEVIKDWFERNTKKLGTVIKSVSDLLYHANHSDRMFGRTERTGGF